MPSPVHPEDMLPDDQNSAEINGTVVRKGTVAAFLANARTLSALPLGSPDREPVIKQLRGSAQALREIGLFDVFELRSRELAELIGLIVVAVLGSAISAALGTVIGLAGKVATNAYPSRSEAFRHKRRRAGLLPVRLPRRAVNETGQHSRRYELASPDRSFGWPIPDLTPATTKEMRKP